MTDALGNQTTFTYDLMSRLTQITYPTTPASTVTFTYDTRGRRTSVTDQNGKVTTYAYDDADRLTSVTDAATNVTSYAYDAENNLTSITDAMGRATGFAYDAYGRVTQTTFPSTLVESYSYDQVGNLVSKTDRKGQTISYAYDNLDRLVTKTYPDTTAVSYTYDLGSRLTQVTDPTGTYGFSYDNMGRLTGTSTQYSFLTVPPFTMAYGYDAASNRTSMTDPQNGATTYAYDTLSRLQTLTSPQGAFGFTYDALSRRTQMTRPNGVNTSYTYDSVSRLLSVLHQIGLTTIDGATYTMDAAGNRVSKTNNLNGVAENYSYDALYQLTQVLKGGSTSEAYTYDGVGNRLSSVGVPSYSYNASNELTSISTTIYTFDNDGNTLTKTDSTGTTSYAWDFENRLVSVTLPGTGGTVTFRYDPFGRRIQKSSATGTTNYLYDGANILEELGATGSILARYTQSPAIDEPLALLRAGATSFYNADGLGSVTSLTDATGSAVAVYTYDAFGNLTSPPGGVTNSLRYTGREFDADTGLYYYRARYYDPLQGRFLSEDPIRLAGGINSYTYAHNNAGNATDPTGLATIYVWWPRPGDAFGHASMTLNNGTHISWWPDNRGLTTPSHKIGCRKCPKHNDYFYNAPAFSESFQTLERDTLNEGHPPDAVIDIDGLDEAAIQAWWDGFKAHSTWDTVDENCSTVVAQALSVGAGEMHVPHPHPVVWSPIDVEAYAYEIRLLLRVKSWF